MTPGESTFSRPGAFEPDYSEPHVKNNYPTCEQTQRRRRPSPPPVIPPLGETAPPWNGGSESR
ncbi:hypothetical protein DRW03_11445 [Corallococcus sp. H22C18031201]|nr:hypothetical protein DRW03_11445 [Corallococcus sp. H22C18031201]